MDGAAKVPSARRKFVVPPGNPVRPLTAMLEAVAADPPTLRLEAVPVKPEPLPLNDAAYISPVVVIRAMRLAVLVLVLR